MPPKRSELLEVVAPPPTVEERDTTACQLCDTVCITDDDSLDQACVDSCACAALPKRQATMSEPVIPDPSCLDCDTACTNATSSSSYYDCLVSCESKNSADCGHTPKRQVGSAV
ncbi:hypothetical protein EJ03DRAFT_332474 [Teratosphaeria nubilosa]|uniref:Uncharacterized protein n=1 Tax=Teratosphaeria nubilosa TaxID=161662 RepID=A0A6G1KT33_9PEZI|nr:hypothetical protein EJ03DRAFT_332474 [Teratosphaeria nubilosa]